MTATNPPDIQQTAMEVIKLSQQMLATPPRMLTTEDVIAQGGVVHEDGKVMFRNSCLLNKDAPIA